MPRGRPWTEAERAAVRAGATTLPGRTAAGCASELKRLHRRSRAGQDNKPKAPAAPVLRRHCLTCRAGFDPEHRGHFVCHSCKASVAWRCAP